MRSAPLANLVRQGKAVVARASAGTKPGELRCDSVDRSGGGGGADERRGLQPGDAVAVTVLEPGPGGGGGGGCYGGGGGAYGGAGWDGYGGCMGGAGPSYQGGGGGGGGGGGSGGDGLPPMVEADVMLGAPLVLKLPDETAAAIARRGGTVRLDKVCRAPAARTLLVTRRPAAQPARRLLTRCQSSAAAQLGNRVAYKRQMSAIFTIHEACERARAEVSGGHAGGASRERTRAEPSAALAAALTAISNGGSDASLRTLASMVRLARLGRAPPRPSRWSVRLPLSCASLLGPPLLAQRVQPSAAASLPDVHRLNESQRAAATAAATQSLTLVQGPPGTGTTAGWKRPPRCHRTAPVLAPWAI